MELSRTTALTAALLTAAVVSFTGSAQAQAQAQPQTQPWGSGAGMAVDTAMGSVTVATRPIIIRVAGATRRVTSSPRLIAIRPAGTTRVWASTPVTAPRVTTPISPVSAATGSKRADKASLLTTLSRLAHSRRGGSSLVPPRLSPHRHGARLPVRLPGPRERSFSARFLSLPEPS